MRKVIENSQRCKRGNISNVIGDGVNSRVVLIQSLIPIGLEAVAEELKKEVELLAGGRYSRVKPDMKRWGCNRGSVYLGDLAL